MEAKKSLWNWESEIQVGPFCDQESAKSTVNNNKNGGGGSLTYGYARFFLLLCIWKNEHF